MNSDSLVMPCIRSVAKAAVVSFALVCQPSTVWCSRERLPAAAAQPAKVRQSCSASDLFILYLHSRLNN
jgi:hypothetical protein